MMKESTENSLYNFKGKMEYIIDILKEFRFTPRYNKEFVLLDNDSERPVLEIIIPMVCWCDIPLERIGNHTSRYGGYGIGISKEWAIKNGINPIIYIIEDTIIARAFSLQKDMIIALQEIMESDSSLKRKLARVTGPLFYASNLVSQYIKPYSYQRIPSRQENRKFYDEKEWRYVPDPIHPFESLTLFPYMYQSDDELSQVINEANEIIKNRYLFFEPDDIRVIILKEEGEKEEVFKCLSNTCAVKGFESKFDSIKEKVKTLDEIRNYGM